MSRQGPETRLKNRICGAIRREYPGAKVIKIRQDAYQERGISDVLVCVMGQFVALEVKVDHRKYDASEHQRNFIRQIQEAGGVAGVVETPEEALILIERAVKASYYRVPSKGSSIIEK